MPGIWFLVRHKDEQNLFNPGSWFGLPNYFIGPAGFFVRREDTDDTKAIPADLVDSAFSLTLEPFDSWSDRVIAFILAVLSLAPVGAAAPWFLLTCIAIIRGRFAWQESYDN